MGWSPNWAGAGAGFMGGALAGGGAASVPMAMLGGIGGLFAPTGQGGQEAQINEIYPQQYSFTEPRLAATSQAYTDFITKEMERYKSGGFPGWYEGISPLLKKEKQKGLREAYYGDQLQPGILGATAAYDVSRGLGRGGAASKTYGTQLQKYAEQEKAIDDYIAELGYTAQKETYSDILPQWLQGSQTMPKGPDFGGFQYEPATDAQPGPMDTILKALAGAYPWLMQGQGGTTYSPYTGGEGYGAPYVNPPTGFTPFQSFSTGAGSGTPSSFYNTGGGATYSPYTGSAGYGAPFVNPSTSSYGGQTRSLSPAQQTGQYANVMGPALLKMLSNLSPLNAASKNLANWWCGIGGNV